MSNKASLQSIVVAGAAAVKDTVGAPVRATDVSVLADPVPHIDDGSIAVRAGLTGLPGGVIVVMGTADAEALASAADGDGAGALASFLTGAVTAIGKLTGREAAPTPADLVDTADISGDVAGAGFRLVLEEGEAAAVLLLEADLAAELGMEVAGAAARPSGNGDGGPTVAAAVFPDLGSGSTAGGGHDLKVLADVAMTVTVELGRTTLRVRELLALTPGSVVELDQPAGSAVDVLVNGTVVARGDVVVVDDELGVRITEVVEQRAS
jgi:flagellar motor switch protein FliN/FliY